MAGQKDLATMPFYVNNDFNYSSQKAIYKVFKSPKGSLISKAVQKIDDHELHGIRKYSYSFSILMKRVIAVSIPIIAMIDTIRYLGVFVWKISTLRPNQALYNLSKCAKSLQIFFASIIFIPVALITPSTVYRTSRMQIEKLKQRLAKKMQEKIQYQDSNEVIKERLIAYAEQKLNNKKNIALLKSMANELTDTKRIKSSNGLLTKTFPLLPPHEDTKREVVLEEYIKLYAYIISYCTTEKVNIDQKNEHFYKVFMKSISYKNPEKRQTLIATLLEKVSNNQSILPLLSDDDKGREKSQHTLPLFVANHITGDKNLMIRLVGVLNGSYFSSQKTVRPSELTAYLQQIEDCDIPKNMKERALTKLIEHFESSEPLFKKEKKQKIKGNKETEKLSKSVDDLRKKLENEQTKKANYENEIKFFKTLYENLKSADGDDKREQLINSAKEKDLENKLRRLDKVPEEKRDKIKEEIEKKNNQLFKEIKKNGPNKKPPRAVSGLEGKLNKLDKEIQGLENRIKAQQEKDQQDNSMESVVDPTEFIVEGIKNLITVLSLNNAKLIGSVLENIGVDKKYSNLGSKEVVSDLFVTTFGLEGVGTEKLHASLQNLRDPAALIKFHNRIQDFNGKERNAIIEASRSLVNSVLEGTFWEERHSTKNNPHLARVFENRPDLKQEWTKAEKTTVGELLPGTGSKYANLKVIDATDPTDIYKVGDDLKTCVTLDGRLNKVVGMVGLVNDGKYHSLLVKSEDGKTVAETQLVLMWDEKKKTPVLYLEETNYVGKSNDDHTLELALIQMAKKKAESMGLDLVSKFDTHKKGKTILEKEYEGTVSSIGSSCPIEYVNTLHKSCTGKYNLGKSYIIWQCSENNLISIES